MNIIEAICIRKSSRTFNGLHLEAATLHTVDTLCKNLSAAPSSDEPATFADIKRPSIRLLADFTAEGMLGTYGVIKGARSFLAMGTGDSPSEQMLAGYLFEKVVLECALAGIDTCWLGGTFAKSGFQKAFNESLGQTEAPAVSIISPIGHRTDKSRFAERVMRRLVSADSRKPFNELFSGIEAPSERMMQTLRQAKHESSRPALDQEQAVGVALECMRLAPSSTNSQPWRAQVSRNLKGRLTGISFSCASSGRLTPCDMGIGYRHFHEAAKYCGLNGEFKSGTQSSPIELFYHLSK